MSSSDLPEGYRLLKTVHRGPHHALFHAQKGEAQFAVRVLDLPDEHAPALDPSMMLQQLGKIPKGLELLGVAPLQDAHAEDCRVTIIEAYQPGDPIEGATFSQLEGLRALLEDLAKLHQRGKWHGGVRPGRILVHEGRLKLCGFTFACWLSTCPPALKKVLEPQSELAPELIATPAAIGPPADVFGISKSLMKVSGLPPALKANLQRGCAEDPRARPKVGALLESLD